MYIKTSCFLVFYNKNKIKPNVKTVFPFSVFWQFSKSLLMSTFTYCLHCLCLSLIFQSVFDLTLPKVWIYFQEHLIELIIDVHFGTWIEWLNAQIFIWMAFPIPAHIPVNLQQLPSGRSPTFQLSKAGDFARRLF